MIDFSSTVPLAYTLSGGVWIVIGVFAIGFVALIFSYFTEKGTEIRFHAWGDQRGDAPGSSGAGNVGKDPTLDVRSWYRGTSPGRHRNVPGAASGARAEGRRPQSCFRVSKPGDRD